MEMVRRMIIMCFFKQKTTYEMRISDWNSDVYSSDLDQIRILQPRRRRYQRRPDLCSPRRQCPKLLYGGRCNRRCSRRPARPPSARPQSHLYRGPYSRRIRRARARKRQGISLRSTRSEEHTSELQSLMRTSYAVICLKKKITTHHLNTCQSDQHRIPCTTHH